MLWLAWRRPNTPIYQVVDETRSAAQKPYSGQTRNTIGDVVDSSAEKALDAHRSSPLDEPTKSLQIAREQLAYVHENFTGQDRSLKMSIIVASAIQNISIKEALELLTELPTGTVYEEGSAALGRKFADLDPAEGVKWLNSLMETREGVNATMAFYNQYARTDPRAAVRSLEDLNPVRQMEGLMAAVQTIANNDTPLLKDLMTHDFFNEMCQRHAIRPQTFVLNAMLNAKDYQGAAKEASGEFSQPKDLARVVASWGRSNPEAAATWLAQAAPGLQDNQLNAAEKLVQAWADTDAGESSEWLRRLSPGLLRDYGAKGLAAAVASKDGSAAAEWVDTIHSGDLRISAAEEVYARWSTYDKTTAEEWIATHRKSTVIDSSD